MGEMAGSRFVRSEETVCIQSNGPALFVDPDLPWWRWETAMFYTCLNCCEHSIVRRRRQITCEVCFYEAPEYVRRLAPCHMLFAERGRFTEDLDICDHEFARLLGE